MSRSPTSGSFLDKIHDVERRLAEELRRALLFQNQKTALNDAYGRGRDVSVLASERRSLLAHFVDDRPEILEIEDRHLVVAGRALIFRPAKRDVQYALLRLRQLHEARKKKRSHFLHGRAHGMSVFPEDVPEDGWKGRIAVSGQADLLSPLHELRRRLARRGDAGKITLDVGREDRDTGSGKPFRQHLQRHRFAGTRGARDEAVAIGESKLDAFGLQFGARFADADEDQPILHIIARIGDGLARPLCAVRTSHFASSYLRTRLIGQSSRR